MRGISGRGRGPAAYAPRKCLVCGAAYSPRSPGQRYCSVACQSIARNERKRLRHTTLPGGCVMGGGDCFKCNLPDCIIG